MQELTPRQQQIYDYIAGCTITPTYSEIGNDLSISEPVVRAHLLRMKKKGVITWDEGKARTTRIVK